MSSARFWSIWNVFLCLAINQADAARNVSISTAVTSGGSFAGGVFTPTSDNANVNVNDVDALLNGGFNVTITTGSTGAQSGNITMSAAVIETGTPGASLTLSAAGSVVLNAINLGSSGANLIILGGGAIAQTGVLTISGAASFSAGANPITLSNAGNNCFGVVSFANSGVNNVSFANSGATVLGASTIGGNFAVTAAGAISQTGVLTVNGTATFNSSGNITLTQANLFLGSVVFSNFGANGITVVNSTSLVLGSSTVGGNFTASVAGALTQLGSLTVGGAATFIASGAITLTQTANLVSGSVSLNNSGPNDVAFNQNGALALNSSGIGGNLSVNASGAITQAGAITVGGTATFSSGGNPITLNNANNSFTGAVVLSTGGPGDGLIANGQATVLGPSTVGGNLAVNSAGAISQTGALTVVGAANFSAGANSITLALANQFFGAVSFSNTGANDVTVVNGPSLLLGTSTVGGNFTANGGGIQLGGNINAGGNLVLAAATGLASNSALAAGSMNLLGALAGNGHTLSASGAVALNGGAIDATNSHFIFQNSFTVGTTFLDIQNWNGSVSGGGASQVVAGTSAGALPVAQLAKVRFVNPTGFASGTYRGVTLATGEIAPTPHPLLQWKRTGNQLILTWTDTSVLQSATNVVGAYVDLASASSPYTNLIGSQPQMYFRLR